jgi:hypothetical protein
LGFRLNQIDIPASNQLVEVTDESVSSNLPTIDEALATYLDFKGYGKSALFFSRTKRSINYLRQCLGSRSLDKYSSADATVLKDWLTKRNFSCSKAVFNFVVHVFGAKA